MRALSSGAGVVAALALALVAVAFCFWPIGGRSAEEWLPIVARHARRDAFGTARPALAGAAGRSTARGGRPAGAGRRASRGRRATSNCSRRRSTASTVGVIKDRRARTYTAVLAVQGDVVRAPRPRRAGEPAGRLGRRARRSRARGIARSAGSSGSSAPCPPTATRSAATSARRGTATSSPLDSLADAVLPRADERRPRP